MSLLKDWTEDDYQRAREKLGLPSSARHREITAAWAEREKETSEALRRLENEGGAVVSETLTGAEVAREVRAVVSDEAIRRYVSVDLPTFDLYRRLVELRLGRRLSDAEWQAGMEDLRQEQLAFSHSLAALEPDR